MMLSEKLFSADHAPLLETLAASERLLIIQDLDGVCMGLVRDPLTRVIDRAYIEAVHALGNRFQVLTNGEHIGSRGVNAIVAAAFETADQASGRYLPGLAGGGVQLQDRHGTVSHPGVSDHELDFLRSVPERATRFLADHLSAAPYGLHGPELATLLQATVLDNLVSPTINLNELHLRLRDHPARYQQLQRDVEVFMQQLLADAARHDLGDAFFVHYAPNLGRDPHGDERMKPGDADSAGTHDFQFMLKGAIKEVGVLVILNRYYHAQTGRYPLGKHFHARAAPRDHDALLQLAVDHFQPELMPRIVGVGDTVSAHAQQVGGQVQMLRGGSDRGFLMLVQDLGKRFASDNAVLYVDSSGGEVHRPGLDAARLAHGADDPWSAVRNISDPQDPLRLNFVFADGHRQYVQFFLALAARLAGQGSVSGVR